MGIINPSLKAFQKTAELGSVHAAAKALRLTQTAVTKRIQALEADLALTLFTRSRRGMRLTDDGAVLLQYCRSLDQLEGALRSQLSGREARNVSLTLAGPTSAISTRVVENCHALYLKFPHLRLHLRADDHGDRVDQVRRGIADLAIVPPENVPNEMDSKVLKPDRYMLVASAQWRGRKLQDILSNERIIDFEESDSTTRNYLKTFGLSSSRPRLFANENAALIQLFRFGLGFGTLTESVARPYLEERSLIALNRAQAMEEPLALIWYPRAHRPDYFAELIRAIR